MTVVLSQEQERLVTEAIRSGEYESPEDVIGRALESLRSEELWLAETRSLAGEKIERAFAQFERGEFLSPEQLQAEMGKRKDEWLQNRP